MRRVVVTGVGLVSSIGNSLGEVEGSLRAARSGISFAPDYADHGFRCQVHGVPDIVLADHIDKRDLRFMGDGAAYNFMAMVQAIKDAGLEPGDVSNERTGLIMGSGGPSTKSFYRAHTIVRETGSPKRMGPFMVTVPEHGLVRIPDRLGYADAATLPCAVVTARGALRTWPAAEGRGHPAGAGDRRRCAVRVAICQGGRGTGRGAVVVK